MRDDTTKPLLRLVDGNILNFSESHWDSGGCDTCHYDSSYVQEFVVQTTLGNYRYDFTNMYEYAVSHDALLKIILPNTAKIQSMKIQEFFEWLALEFAALDDNPSDVLRYVKFQHGPVK